MAAFSEEFLSENDFEAVLATFCCCEHGYVCCYDLLKRHNQHLFLTIWWYVQYEWWPEWKQIYMYLENQTNKSAVVEWNEGMNIGTRHKPFYTKYPFISILSGAHE